MTKDRKETDDLLEEDIPITTVHPFISHLGVAFLSFFLGAIAAAYIINRGLS